MVIELKIKIKPRKDTENICVSCVCGGGGDRGW